MKTMSAEVLALWDFDDPAESRAKFEAAAEGETDPARRLVWLTQVARAHGLAGEYAEAHAVLDGLEDNGHVAAGGERAQADSGHVAAGGERAQAGSGHVAAGSGQAQAGSGRVALERGRVLRSSGDVAGSVPLFRKAFDDSMAAGERGLAADAAHMLALVLPEEHEEWAGRGLEVAEGRDDPLAWSMTGALLNNLGWKLADEERWAEAYELFDRAVGARERVAETVASKGTAESLHVARWCRARAARALGRHEEALAELRALDQSDPYVQEEISLLS
ncbi:MAG TPA: hypothetical protein VFC19_04030 [Candidatus Limnocylindrales bacterium]|nr:hypothetical protein [Candidatus Limnocylindrales bacterium]